MTLDAADWAHLLRTGIRFKRDYLFTFTAVDPGRLQMQLNVFTQDARQPVGVKNVRPYTSLLDITPQVRTATVLEFVRQSIRRFELHEVDEFLTYFDYRINDPHAAGVDPDPQETTP